MERIGIYGGTFNPPHIGHIRAAEYAAEALGLEKVLLIPSCIAPHKALPANSPTPEQRLEMLRRSAGDKLEVCDVEINRGGTSFTFETVEQLHTQYPDKELVLLMGTDMFLSFQSWREPERILRHASIGVFYRGSAGEGEQIEVQRENIEKKGAKVYLVKNPITEISSTQLRRLLVFCGADSFLPEGAASYIREHGLYGSNRDCRNLPIEELEQVVVELLKPNRVAHVLGCRDTAAALARHWGANETDAARAGLLHDITKALDGPLQLTLCQEYGIILDKFSEKNPKTLHAITGSLVAERIFGENKQVSAAIRSHTTGKADMSLLEKILYLADYVEPNRDFPGVEALRSLTWQDLDKAMKMGLQMTLELLKQQSREISPESTEALLFLQKAGL